MSRVLCTASLFACKIGWKGGASRSNYSGEFFAPYSYPRLFQHSFVKGVLVVLPLCKSMKQLYYAFYYACDSCIAWETASCVKGGGDFRFHVWTKLKSVHLNIIFTSIPLDAKFGIIFENFQPWIYIYLPPPLLKKMFSICKERNYGNSSYPRPQEVH